MDVSGIVGDLYLQVKQAEFERNALADVLRQLKSGELKLKDVEVYDNEA
jgi:hypothetical protein